MHCHPVSCQPNVQTKPCPKLIGSVSALTYSLDLGFADTLVLVVDFVHDAVQCICVSEPTRSCLLSYLLGLGGGRNGRTLPRNMITAAPPCLAIYSKCVSEEFTATTRKLASLIGLDSRHVVQVDALHMMSSRCRVIGRDGRCCADCHQRARAYAMQRSTR